MDIKIITRHAPSNYGSLLQALATAIVFGRRGHQCNIIDYQRKDERGIGALRAEVARKPRWNKNVLFRAAYMALRAPGALLAQWRFDRWRREMLPLTPRVADRQQLNRLSADMFLTGSDQVWGPVADSKIDKAYFLDFTDDRARRTAYAASFGRTDLLPLDEIAPLLKRYDKITVRESSAAEIIRQNCRACPTIVADPTLLLSRDEWFDILGIDKQKHTKPYVLVYQLHNNPAVNEFAVAVAKRLGLKLRRVSPYIHQAVRPGRFTLLPSPAEFVRLIDQASLLVTDSFHGTAFAINCGTQFVDVLPDNGTATRNKNILRLMGLDRRVAHGTDSLHLVDTPIDFTEVHERLRELRAESLAVANGLCE